MERLRPASHEQRRGFWRRASGELHELLTRVANRIAGEVQVQAQLSEWPAELRQMGGGLRYRGLGRPAKAKYLREQQKRGRHRKRWGCRWGQLVNGEKF